jgi:hypothetical protein
MSARVFEIDGKLVLDDPEALAMIRGVAKHNCRLTFEGQNERVIYFKRRMRMLDHNPNNVIIVLLNVDDPNGGKLAEILMPGHKSSWQAFRDAGQVPFARGLATRAGVQELVMVLDKETGEKLAAMVDKVAVIVMDHGVVEAFEA